MEVSPSMPPLPLKGCMSENAKPHNADSVDFSCENQETVCVNYGHLFVNLYRSELKAVNTGSLSVCVHV